MGRVTYDFSGKSVLVTGASRGIGYGVAKGFAQAGADVSILADDDGVTDAATRLADETGGNVRALQCDITDVDQLRAVMSEISRIDVLINNAGLERITPLADPDKAVEDTFRRIVDINVIGTFLVTRHALARMPDGGRIILTASIWGRTAVGEFSAYCATKHANIGFMRSIAHELAPRQINVNAVCPGWVRTDAAMLSLANMSKRSGRPESDLLDEIMSAQVIGGLLEPDDMAPLYLFLASDAARDITGQAYGLDRGEVMA
ncbi:SDR family NAD(P)-dependent oxidoreductase [uncultured Roseovarius sp.]|uniref:SDR family NAD(P)-dependent oxidoreductase n=1 Tax=uncultured Roseovarius sp. TaxID=293344 RepID=UPI002625F810|nr:SDR family oxidoreductase [uncultured Roseovarius sp.]